DVVANRVPNVFINHAKTGERLFVDQIERLAGGLDAAGALVIFPEGGNWTPNRWQRGIARLEQLGRRDLAARARPMPNLLAPRGLRGLGAGDRAARARQMPTFPAPRGGGAFPAIAACPSADVIFVAHAGLDRLVTVADVWRNLQVGQTIRARWWRVPADEVPR